MPCSALTRGEERQKRTCCQSITQVTDRLPRARRGGRQAPHGIRRNPPGQPRRVPLRGASQCLKSMSYQLAYRRVWQKVHAKQRDFCHSHNQHTACPDTVGEDKVLTLSHGQEKTPAVTQGCCVHEDEDSTQRAGTATILSRPTEGPSYADLALRPPRQSPSVQAQEDILAGKGVIREGMPEVE